LYFLICANLDLTNNLPLFSYSAFLVSGKHGADYAMQVARK